MLCLGVISWELLLGSYSLARYVAARHSPQARQNSGAICNLRSLVQATMAYNMNGQQLLRRAHRLTSSTGTLKAASNLWRVAAARLLLQLLMKRRGGGLEDG